MDSQGKIGSFAGTFVAHNTSDGTSHYLRFRDPNERQFRMNSCISHDAFPKAATSPRPTQLTLCPREARLLGVCGLEDGRGVIGVEEVRLGLHVSRHL